MIVKATKDIEAVEELEKCKEKYEERKISLISPYACLQKTSENMKRERENKETREEIERGRNIAKIIYSYALSP